MRSRILALSTLLLTACPGPSTRDGGAGGLGPSISAIAPRTGPISGGTVVTITGARFQDGASVWFGEVQGLEVIVESGARLTVKTPPHAIAGPVKVALTNPDGDSATSDTDFTYEGGAGLVIEEAVLENAATTTDGSGAATVKITVRADVQAGNTTRGAGQGAGITAQVGFASTLSTPPAASDFTWTAAAYAGDVDGAAAGDKARDQYGGELSLPGATAGADKTYTLAARFSGDHGSSWTIADRNGSANGLQAAQLAQLTVAVNGIGWCKLGGPSVEAPPQVTLKVGQVGPTIYAQVYKEGTTNAVGKGAGIIGELGYGSAGALPSTWTWAAAVYNTDTGSGANDEYQAALPNPGLGGYVFAYRFRPDGGAWLYCDADGAANGFDELQAGKLLVEPPGITNCTLQHVTAASVMSGGRLSGYVRVLVPGVTPDAGAAPGLLAQLGVGTLNVNASTSPEWGWREAAFSSDIAATGEDEFSLDFSAAYTGSRAVAARASLDDGGTWTSCDTDGSQNGYDATKQWGLTVTQHTDFDWCNTQYPPTASVDAGVTTVYGRVAKAGLTPDAGAGIVAELGVGPIAEDPGIASSWTWTKATFNTVPADNSNEYAASLVPSGVGRAYAFRYTRDGGSFCYGDLNASNVGGFSGGNGTVANLGAIVP